MRNLKRKKARRCPPKEAYSSRVAHKASRGGGYYGTSSYGSTSGTPRPPAPTIVSTIEKTIDCPIDYKFELMSDGQLNITSETGPYPRYHHVKLLDGKVVYAIPSPGQKLPSYLKIEAERILKALPLA